MQQRRNAIKFEAKTIKSISIDTQYGCMYIRFSNEKVAHTIEHSEIVNIDMAKDGEVIGIEFVSLKRPARTIFLELAKIYNRPELKKVPSALRHQLQAITA